MDCTDCKVEKYVSLRFDLIHKTNPARSFVNLDEKEAKREIKRINISDYCLEIYDSYTMELIETADIETIFNV